MNIITSSAHFRQRVIKKSYKIFKKYCILLASTRFYIYICDQIERNERKYDSSRGRY